MVQTTAARSHRWPIFLLAALVSASFSLVPAAAERAVEDELGGVPTGYRYVGPGEPDAPPMFGYSFTTTPDGTVFFREGPSTSASFSPGPASGPCGAQGAFVSHRIIAIGDCFSLEVPDVELDDLIGVVRWGIGNGWWLNGATIIELSVWDVDTTAWAMAAVVFDQAGTFQVHTASSDPSVMAEVGVRVRTATGMWGLDLAQRSGDSSAGGALEPLGTLEIWDNASPVATPEGPWLAASVRTADTRAQHDDPQVVVAAGMGEAVQEVTIPLVEPPLDPIGGPVWTGFLVHVRSSQMGDEAPPVLHRPLLDDHLPMSRSPLDVCLHRTAIVGGPCVVLD